MLLSPLVPLLLSSPAAAEDARHALIRRDVMLCDAPHDKGKCVQFAALAEPNAAWRDPWNALVLAEDAGWIQVQGSADPNGLCMPGPTFPVGLTLRAWVRADAVVPATVRPLTWEAGGTTVVVPAGVPVGLGTVTGAIGLAAKPFLGTLIVPKDATAPYWVPSPRPTEPAGAGSWKIAYGYTLDFGEQGNGSILPGFLHAAQDAGAFVVQSDCVVARSPEALLAQSELVKADPPPPKAATAPAKPVTVPKGTAVYWESGKPAGEAHADTVVDSAGFAAKGKMACGPVAQAGLKRTMTLCFPKDAVPITK